MEVYVYLQISRAEHVKDLGDNNVIIVVATLWVSISNAKSCNHRENPNYRKTRLDSHFLAGKKDITRAYYTMQTFIFIVGIVIMKKRTYVIIL